jgi:hypothetical protein
MWKFIAGLICALIALGIAGVAYVFDGAMC